MSSFKLPRALRLMWMSSMRSMVLRRRCQSPGVGDDASEAYLGKRSKGKGKGRGKGRNRKGKGKGMETDPADIEVVSPSKSVESEAENSQAEDQEEEVRIQDGESFAEACFAAALEHDEQERPPRARGRKWYWKRKN